MQHVALALVALSAPMLAQEAKTPDPELLKLFAYDDGADPLLDIVSTQEAGTYRLMDITYESPMGGRVPGYIFEPLEEGEHAGIIMMHGLPGSRDDALGWAPEVVAQGAVVLAISAPWARPGVEGGPVTFTDKDPENQVQLMQDLRRGVDLLQMLPNVDAERIGYVGGSYGGAMGGLLAGIEHRIKTYILVLGDGGLVAHFRGDEEREAPPEGISWERWNEWLSMMKPIEPSSWVGFAQAELLFQNGKTDPYVPAKYAELYHRSAEGTKHTVKWYETGHDITVEIRRDQMKWLAKRLGMKPPSGV